MSAQQIKDLNQPITIALYGVVFLTFVIGMIVDFEAGKAIPKSTKFMRLISILFVVAILIFTIVPMFGQIAENNFEHG
jgi:Kef-type K+ transport system membrane component KefB